MLLFYVCFCNHLGALGFVGPDEPRYASIARAMAETSDWVTPRLNGQPWFEKPVLYYWKAGVTFRLFGVSESAARLPSALSATFAALVMAWAARRRFGRAAALLTVLFMTTAVGMIGFARAATPDMLFAACLAGTMAAAAEFLWPVAGESRPNAFFRISLGVLLGGAALAKGPAALVLAGGSVALWTFASRRWRDALRLLDPLAMLSFLIVALPWHIVCALRNPDFLRVFFLSHNLERYLTPVFHHEQPAWYFVGILALGLAPWTFLIVPLARDAFRSWRAKSAASSPALFFAAWVAFPFFFFSFSKSKLPGYILPAIPPLILLLARSAARLLEENNLLARLSSGAIGASFIAAGFSLNHWLKRLPAASEVVSLQAVLGLALACAAGGLAILLLGVSGSCGARCLLLRSLLRPSWRWPGSASSRGSTPSSLRAPRLTWVRC